MSQSESYIDRNPDLWSAVADAGRLVDQCRGGDLDPIVEALDERLLDGEGGVGPALVAQLRRDIATAVDLHARQSLSGRQVAASLLCAPDDRITVPVLAATAGGVAALVPVIAVTLFGGLDPPALAIGSVLAALVDARGLGAFCQDMGRSIPVDRLES